MEAKRVARSGVVAALLAVSAQVMVPIGPVPFTLQTLVLAIAVAPFVVPDAVKIAVRARLGCTVARVVK